MKSMVALLLAISGLNELALAESPYPSFPAGVMAAYLNEDAAGSGWSSETFPRLIRYAVWPEAPGWDTVTVITSFSIGDAKVSGSKAKIRVSYNVLGQLANDTFKKAPATETVTYSLSKAVGKWVVEEPQLMPHIAVADVIRLSKARETPTAELKVSLKELQGVSR
ncbi:hypothetical protein BH09VER1_BH09VER1_38630 [soil metagenome]